MSRISHLPKTIPVKKIPFKVKIKGIHTKHTYEGDFVVEVPGTREVSQIGVELARLNGGIPLESLDRSTATLNNAIAYLKVVVKSAPAWFLNSTDDKNEEGIDYGLDTIDVNVPVEIFKKADRAIGEWYEALRGQPKDEESPSDEPKA